MLNLGIRNKEQDYLHGLKVSARRLLVSCKGENQDIHSGEPGQHLAR